MRIDLLELLREAARGTNGCKIVYRTEWLGYLPFGAYQWVEVGGKDISTSLPVGWCQADLESLESEGFLTTVGVRLNPADEWDKRIEYEVRLP